MDNLKTLKKEYQHIQNHLLKIENMISEKMIEEYLPLKDKRVKIKGQKGWSQGIVTNLFVKKTVNPDYWCVVASVKNGKKKSNIEASKLELFTIEDNKISQLHQSINFKTL